MATTGDHNLAIDIPPNAFTHIDRLTWRRDMAVDAG